MVQQNPSLINQHVITAYARVQV